MNKIKFVVYCLAALLCTLFLVIDVIDMQVAKNVGDYAKATYNLIFAMINILIVASLLCFIQDEWKKRCK